MATPNPPRIIEFTNGNLAGQRAYVTHDDGEYMRVTPVDGEPLCSIEVEIAAGGFIEAQDQEWIDIPRILRRSDD